MDAGDNRAYVRVPEAADVARICRALNAAGARYILIGGFARLAEAAQDAETVEIEGVPIPVASKRTLIRTKNTVRPSDRSDVAYLEALLRSEER